MVFDTVLSTDPLVVLAIAAVFFNCPNATVTIASFRTIVKNDYSWPWSHAEVSCTVGSCNRKPWPPCTVACGPPSVFCWAALQPTPHSRYENCCEPHSIVSPVFAAVFCIALG